MIPRSKNETTESFENEGVRVRSMENCLPCGRQGRLLYGALSDQLFSAPGSWNLLKCGGCGHVWLNPQPLREDIGKLYVHYPTHRQERSAVSSLPVKASLRDKVLGSVLAAHLGYPNIPSSRAWERIGKIGRLVPLLRDWAGCSVMHLPAALCGRLLDVGCGSGGFIAAMRERGWQVQGVEPDPEAALVARESFGLEVTCGTLEEAALPGASVDAITLHHVIEHVLDPVALLTECCRVLRPRGRLVAVTPNVESLGHRFFKSCWRGLELPRHLHLFSLRSLQTCADRAGLHTESLRSIGRLSREIYIFSHAIRHGVPNPHNGYHPDRHVAYQAWAFLALEEPLRLLDGKMGEELVLIATRPG